MRGRDGCSSSEGRTQPRYIAPSSLRVCGVGGPHKTTIDHRERAAIAATAEPTSGI